MTATTGIGTTATPTANGSTSLTASPTAASSQPPRRGARGALRRRARGFLEARWGRGTAERRERCSPLTTGSSRSCGRWVVILRSSSRSRPSSPSSRTPAADPTSVGSRRRSGPSSRSRTTPASTAGRPRSEEQTGVVRSVELAGFGGALAFVPLPSDLADELRASSSSSSRGSGRSSRRCTTGCALPVSSSLFRRNVVSHP
jgi:hypothetical protein